MLRITEPMKTWAETEREISQVIDQTIDTANGELTDGAARCVAAQWQSPGVVGSVLAALASGAEVDDQKLYDDIAATARQARPMWPAELECLATWAINTYRPREA